MFLLICIIWAAFQIDKRSHELFNNRKDFDDGSVAPRKAPSFLKILIHCWGNAFSQPFPKQILGSKNIHITTDLIIRFYDLSSFMLATMYCSIIIFKVFALGFY